MLCGDAQSQLGPRAGELMLQEDTQVVSGYLSLLGRRSRFSGSVLTSGKYLISGDLRSPVDQEPYDAIFTVRDGRLSGGLITRHGCWDLTGVPGCLLRSARGLKNRFPAGGFFQKSVLLVMHS